MSDYYNYIENDLQVIRVFKRDSTEQQGNEWTLAFPTGASPTDIDGAIVLSIDPEHEDTSSFADITNDCVAQVSEYKIQVANETFVLSDFIEIKDGIMHFKSVQKNGVIIPNADMPIDLEVYMPIAVGSQPIDGEIPEWITMTVGDRKFNFDLSDINGLQIDAGVGLTVHNTGNIELPYYKDDYQQMYIDVGSYRTFATSNNENNLINFKDIVRDVPNGSLNLHSQSEVNDVSSRDLNLVPYPSFIQVPKNQVGERFREWYEEHIDLDHDGEPTLNDLYIGIKNKFKNTFGID